MEVKPINPVGNLPNPLNRSPCQMPLALTDYDDSLLCKGQLLEVRDQGLLVEVVSELILQRIEHAVGILEGIRHPSSKLRIEAAKKWIEQLRAPEANTKDPYNRDGYLFQLISWIVAYKTYPGGLLQGPHSRLADKGFDGLILAPLSSDPSRSVGADFSIIVGEDKATENPRDEIRDHVWPSFTEWDAGGRDTEIQAVLPALLPKELSDDDRIKMIDKLFAKPKLFRVAITVSFDQMDQRRRKSLFHAYDTIIPGSDIRRRRADLMHFDDLRTWMSSFSEATARQLEMLLSAAT